MNHPHSQHLAFPTNPGAPIPGGGGGQMPANATAAAAPFYLAPSSEVEDLKRYLATAPQLWTKADDPPIRSYQMSNNETISCVFWRGKFFITGTDIVKVLLFRFAQAGRPVLNVKKFEEGIFSDLRNLKPGNEAILEEPRSEFLEFLFKHNCIRTQKKQKVFFWNCVPHESLFLDAIERDFKREGSLYHMNLMMNHTRYLQKQVIMMQAQQYANGMLTPGGSSGLSSPYPTAASGNGASAFYHPLPAPTIMPNSTSSMNGGNRMAPHQTAQNQQHFLAASNTMDPFLLRNNSHLNNHPNNNNKFAVGNAAAFIAAPQPMHHTTVSNNNANANMFFETSEQDKMNGLISTSTSGADSLWASDLCGMGDDASSNDLLVGSIDPSTLMSSLHEY